MASAQVRQPREDALYFQEIAQRRAEIRATWTWQERKRRAQEATLRMQQLWELVSGDKPTSERFARPALNCVLPG